MAQSTVVFLVLFAWLGAAFGQQQNTLYWTIKDDALFSSNYTLKGPSGSTVVTLPGRSLVALSEAKRRIGEQFGLRPRLVISNQPGINAFATDTTQGALVAINAETITALGDNADMWAALLGHEFSHVYHHHVADHKLRASLIGLAATVLDTYQKQQGKDQTELINFGATLIDNTFTRDQEREADATSIEYMVKAGYNPEGAIQLQQLFLSKYGSSGALSFLQSHPAGEERIQLLRQKIAKNATPNGVPVLTTTEFNRWLSLCGSETRDKGIERNKSFASTFACMHKQNPETAKRYALCAGDLDGRGQMNQSALADCAAHGYNQSQFGYLPWSTYCAQIARQQNSSLEVALAQMNKCVWANAEPVALRGYLCEVDAAQTRIPVEERAAFLRGCTADTTDVKVKFDFGEWELACKRKGTSTAYLADEQASIERACLAQGPEAPKGPTGNNRSALTPQQILAEVTAALNKLKPQLAAGANECDRLASTESFEGSPSNYIGFIDTVAAEPVCRAALKSEKDASRTQVNLAGIAFQAGRFAEAASLAQQALKKNALNAGTLLAELQFNGLNGPIDYKKGYELLLNDAKRGSLDAITDLAVHILSGHGIEAQPAIALDLARLAAERGSAAARGLVGQYYAAGKIVAQDKNEAMRLYRVSAETVPPATLGILFGLRSSQSPLEQAELKQMAARAIEQATRFSDMGSLTAKQMLATIYDNGLGVPIDRAKALGFYEEVAKFGLPSANIALAFAYLNGTGVSQSRERALFYFKRAVAGGSKEAETQIARIQAMP